VVKACSYSPSAPMTNFACTISVSACPLGAFKRLSVTWEETFVNAVQVASIDDSLEWERTPDLAEV
jgi:hypothetical protein